LERRKRRTEGRTDENKDMRNKLYSRRRRFKEIEE
jgi:hypothetical protein